MCSTNLFRTLLYQSVPCWRMSWNRRRSVCFDWRRCRTAAFGTVAASRAVNWLGFFVDHHWDLSIRSVNQDRILMWCWIRIHWNSFIVFFFVYEVFRVENFCISSIIRHVLSTRNRFFWQLKPNFISRHGRRIVRVRTGCSIVTVYLIVRSLSRSVSMWMLMLLMVVVECISRNRDVATGVVLTSGIGPRRATSCGINRVLVFSGRSRGARRVRASIRGIIIDVIVLFHFMIVSTVSAGKSMTPDSVSWRSTHGIWETKASAPCETLHMMVGWGRGRVDRSRRTVWRIRRSWGRLSGRRWQVVALIAEAAGRVLADHHPHVITRLEWSRIRTIGHDELRLTWRDESDICESRTSQIGHLRSAGRVKENVTCVMTGMKTGWVWYWDGES